MAAPASAFRVLAPRQCPLRRGLARCIGAGGRPCPDHREAAQSCSNAALFTGRSTVPEKRSAASMRSACPQMPSCSAGSLICSSIGWAVRAPRLAVSTPASAIRHRPGANHAGSRPRSSGLHKWSASCPDFNRGLDSIRGAEARARWGFRPPALHPVGLGWGFPMSGTSSLRRPL
jgi:hypothetical protein